MITDSAKKKILSYLGLARKSGKAVLGADRVISAVRGKQCFAVLLADDASARTGKQIRDKCSSYGAPLVECGITGDELAKAAGAGMTLSAAAVTDRGIAGAILSEAGSDPQNNQLNERIFPRESGNR